MIIVKSFNPKNQPDAWSANMDMSQKMVFAKKFLYSVMVTMYKQEIVSDVNLVWNLTMVNALIKTANNNLIMVVWFVLKDIKQMMMVYVLNMILTVWNQSMKDANNARLATIWMWMDNAPNSPNSAHLPIPKQANASNVKKDIVSLRQANHAKKIYISKTVRWLIYKQETAVWSVFMAIILQEVNVLKYQNCVRTIMFRMDTAPAASPLTFS